MSILPVGTNTLYLAGAGVTVGATSVVLQGFSDIYGNALSMANFGAKGFLTVEPDVNNQEFLTFSSVTVNANNTVTLGGIKTTLAVSPFTETSGTVRAHAGGVKAVISDAPAFWSTFANKNNNETITGTWTAPTGGTGGQIATATDIANAVTGVSGTASTTVFGTVKTTTATTTVVSTDDTRLPTQNENDALVGTSGTAVSTSNKLVDNADTATSGANKVLRLDGTGKLPALDASQLTNPPAGINVINSFTAGGIINTGNAVSLGIYQNGAGLVIENKQVFTLTTYTQAFTVGVNSNRAILVFLSDRGGSSAFASVQYHGVSLTTIDSNVNSPGGSYTGYLINPDTGSNNLTFTYGGGGSGGSIDVVIYSFYNAAQSAAFINAHNLVSNSTSAASATPTIYGSIGVGFVKNISSGTITPGGNFNKENSLSVTNWLAAGDTSVITPITTITASGQGAQGGAEVVVVTPFNSASIGAVQASSATGLFSNYLSTDFIGFASNTVSVGQTVNVVVAGKASGLSGLSAFSPYYLADTVGTIGTSVGTVTRKVGIAVSATEILITNIW
jgi:hypothetical protein